MASGRRREQSGDLHSEIVNVLMDKVRADPFPSVTHLDLVEEMLHEDEVDDYAKALLDKVRGDSYPSLDHLRRLRRLA